MRRGEASNPQGSGGCASSASAPWVRLVWDILWGRLRRPSTSHGGARTRRSRASCGTTSSGDERRGGDDVVEPQVVRTAARVVPHLDLRDGRSSCVVGPREIRRAVDPQRDGTRRADDGPNLQLGPYTDRHGG